MGLLRDARVVELYYREHPEKLIVKGRYEDEFKELERNLDNLRKKGVIIKTIKKR